MYKNPFEFPVETHGKLAFRVAYKLNSWLKTITKVNGIP